MNDSYFIFLLFFFSFSSSFSFSDTADRFVPCLRSSFLRICEKPANRSRQFAGQTVKKVRNRQNQSTNKKCFYGIRRLDFAFRFFDQPTDSVIARRAHFLRPTRQSLTMRFVIPKRNMVLRNEAANLIFCNKLFLFASCSRASPRDAILSPLRLPRPRCGLAMTRN